MDRLEGMMKALEMPDVTPALKQTVIDGVLKEARGNSVEQLANEENDVLLGLLVLRTKAGNSLPVKHRTEIHHMSIISTSSETTREQGSPGMPETPSPDAFSSSIWAAAECLSANPDGSDLKTIVVRKAESIPDGLAIDVAAGHLYWTSMGNPSANDGSILRSDLDGRNMTTIVPPGGTFTPKQLQIEKTTGKLYWCDREGMRVMRGNLDGSHIETLVDSSQGDLDQGRTRRSGAWASSSMSMAANSTGRRRAETNAGEGRLFRANIEIPPGPDGLKTRRYRAAL